MLLDAGVKQRRLFVCNSERFSGFCARGVNADQQKTTDKEPPEKLVKDWPQHDFRDWTVWILLFVSQNG